METTKVIQKAYEDVRTFNAVAGNLKNVTADSIDNQISFIFEELTETITAFEEGNNVEVLDGAIDLFVTVTGLMQKLEAKGYDVATAIQRVNANNLSKFPLTDSVGPGYNIPIGSSVTINSEYGRLVYKNSVGKVQKPIGFKPVDLSDLVPKENDE